jgi:enoyl-CoA hydratase/carnithine racemase
MNVDARVDRDVAVVTLTGPGANLLAPPAFDEPRRVLEGLCADEAIKAIVVRGAGRHFSAGADVAALAGLARADGAGLEREIEAGRAFAAALTFAPVPTVAEIRGSCLGGGLELALACHFRVASENALLGFPEATLGLLPGLGGPVAAAEVLPRRVLLDLLLSGRAVDGREALALGLVDRAVPTRELAAATAAFVDGLVGRRSPGLVRSIVAAIHNARRLDRDAALREEGRLFFALARAKSHGDEAGNERA